MGVPQRTVPDKWRPVPISQLRDDDMGGLTTSVTVGEGQTQKQKDELRDARLDRYLYDRSVPVDGKCDKCESTSGLWRYRFGSYWLCEQCRDSRKELSPEDRIAMDMDMHRKIIAEWDALDKLPS
jgi:hypothetical protein